MEGVLPFDLRNSDYSAQLDQVTLRLGEDDTESLLMQRSGSCTHKGH